jgi:hypothetical protein
MDLIYPRNTDLKKINHPDLEERQDEGDRRASDSAETVVAQRSNDQSGEGKKNEKKDGEDDHIMVDWYSEDDPENPQNWYVSPSFLKLSSLAVTVVADN